MDKFESPRNRNRSALEQNTKAGMTSPAVDKGTVACVVGETKPVDIKHTLGVVETRREQLSKFKTKFTQSIIIEESDNLSASATFIIACISDRGRPTVLKAAPVLFDQPLIKS